MGTFCTELLINSMILKSFQFSHFRAGMEYFPGFGHDTLKTPKLQSNLLKTRRPPNSEIFWGKLPDLDKNLFV